jgi:hypothetical protein
MISAGYHSLSWDIFHCPIPSWFQYASAQCSLSLENPAWLNPIMATFCYPQHTPFTEHMYIYWCIQGLLPFPRPAGLGEAAGAAPAGARFAAPPPQRPTCTAGRGRGVGALPSAAPRRLWRWRRRWRRRCGCRAEAVGKAAVAEARHSYEI